VYFTWRATYMCDGLTKFVLQWKMFQTKVVENVKTHFMFNFFL
jgi:hypothetical protein